MQCQGVYRPGPAKASLTTVTLKWDSEPGGTLCMWLSLTTSRCKGANRAPSLDSIICWTDIIALRVRTDRGF